jgi:hypothetical protein
VPTEAAFRADVHDLSVLVEKLWSGKTSIFDVEDTKNQVSLQFAALVHEWHRCEIKTKRDYPKIYSAMLSDRASGALETVLATSAYLSEDEVFLRACVTAICDARPLQELQSVKARTQRRC